MWVSGSGKWTIRTNIQNEEIKNLEFLKSYVTREMRPGEENGDQYWFVSKEDFETGIQNNDFLEYEINHKVAYYGTKKSDVDSGLENGNIMLKEIDTKWLKQLSENHPNFKENYTSFFLDVSNKEMTRRYLERHSDGCEDDIQNRLESADLEREQAEKYCDYIIDASQSPEQVLSEVLDIIKH
jgi:guanylate kinase